MRNQENLPEAHAERRTDGRLNSPCWKRLRGRFPATGDDAAVLPGGLLASVDTLVEGVDWRPEWSSPADVGLEGDHGQASDIAAMGGRPTSLPRFSGRGRRFDVDAFYDGVEEARAVVGGEVVGGRFVRLVR